MDRNNETPLQVAKRCQQNQEEERQSVARWDVVAGGASANWDQCVSLLQETEKEIVGASVVKKNENELDTSTAPKTDGQAPIGNTIAVSTKLPRHRFADFDCLNCEPNRECVTLAWSSAFQKALQQSVCIPVPPSVSSTHQQSNKENDATQPGTPQFSETLSFQDPALDNNEMIQSQPRPEEYSTQASPDSSSSLTGRSCASCGTQTIVLFPCNINNNKVGLVCKKCKPPRRRREMMM